MHRTLTIGLLWCVFGPHATAQEGASGQYRVPENPAVRHLLTASQVPQVLFNARSGRVAFVYRETLIPLARIATPHLGLAGYWLDPKLRTSGYESWVERVVVIDARSGAALATWARTGEPSMDDVQFSPDGKHLSAVSFRGASPGLVVFDIETERERELPVVVNPAFGSPCTWSTPRSLLCRLVPDPKASPPAAFVSPNLIEHVEGEARTRTYTNLLDSAFEEVQFEHYFSSVLARVGIDGKVRRYENTAGLLARVRSSLGHEFALVIRLQRPYSHLLTASRFGRRVEVWDLERGVRLDAGSLPQASDVTPTSGPELPRFSWKQGRTPTLGWTESLHGGGERWVALDPPFSGTPREVARSAEEISGFGWTSAGTPYFTHHTEAGTRVSYFVVRDDGVHRFWEGAVKEQYDNPGKALRTDGNSGAVLEVKRHVLMAGDGLGVEGARPFVDALDLDTLVSERVATAPAGIYERVVAVFDPARRGVLTVRESETEAPQLYSVLEGRHTPLGVLGNPFPELDGVERSNVNFTRKDGVLLNGTLYLPRNRKPGQPLPTLVWIYPTEFSDSDYAEQMDARRFRYHQIKEASPIAAVLEGYALLLNPTVPIIGEGESANEAYLSQLVMSLEAATDYLVESGISDRNRMAVAGRSYGAFSSANLLVHTDLFRTGIAVSGAYNRTLTPFGFQHEKRSFWEATDFYTRISPFYRADEINEPLLLMHGGADDNPGTPTAQAQRFFHALAGNGVHVRYVELPFERHHYRARESVLHASAEMLEWLDRTIGTAP